MENLKSDFLRFLGQTNPFPVALNIDRAEGVFIYTSEGKRYFDLISGFSVSNTGHGNPKVKEAIKKQLDKYLHTMVYGEFVQAPQVEYAKLLCSVLPATLNQVFFVNSGTEAIEGALKLAKRQTGRSELISFHKAYHGSTHGALSMMGDEKFKTAYRPLLPDTRLINFNQFEDLDKISERTAAVLVEPIQAEAGIIEPENDFLKALRQKCSQTGSILIFDEVQTGFGRTGSLFAFEQFDIVPDILVLAKALGGGLPLGAFISDNEIMSKLSHNPVLGHITTFGGHPLSCAAGKAALEVIIDNKLANESGKMGQWILDNLNHPLILEKRGRGLFLGFKLPNADYVNKMFKSCMNLGLLFDFYLFNNDSFRIAPPLTVSQSELEEMLSLIIQSLNEIE
ncbi:MAG: aspartate aminotransferase family protein [Bacteroidetes bacterium]|jgi:acetylornithine/succinyldiaminopimelate/putrescine aminotransferase|nr:aspartate aminotransferase family protein [Bacteroidota bacterium]MBT3750811.1 aspartate aminotransferase family protein [Bacteroidota bacterium]MBT4399871.1 aspartate aminotransferase family protein [Bacteroidota bacterium]MBT4409865.1 aspartate aminotransferase family protein [Bacteroidota bacterium]MBT5426764.1 aspartate aminotransferase family protein [Bacteroidota bacterium]